MEGSVTLWMADTYALEKIRHPYQRTYRDDKQARWETDGEYCNNYGESYQKKLFVHFRIKIIVYPYLKTQGAIFRTPKWKQNYQ